MGTWASPTTAEKANRLADLMSEPVPLRGAEERLYGLMGDDTLFDMISSARSFHPAADARSLVAAVLDEWLNWTPRDSWTKPWEDGVEETLEAVFRDQVERIGDDDVLHLLAKFGMSDARKAVAEFLELPEAAAQAVKVEPGLVPATYAATSPDGRLFRFDRIWGVLVEAPGPLAAGIAEKLSGAVEPPSVRA